MILVLLGLAFGAVAALLAFVGALTRVPAAKGRRVALAAAMGGTIAFTLTGATQIPFYGGGDIKRLAVPLMVAGAAGAVGAMLAGWMILRARPPRV